MKKIGYILISGLLLSAYSGSARENAGSGHRQQSSSAPRMAGCYPGSTKTDLAVNNVRAKIFTAGDMWWDLVTSAKYEVPKGSGKTSLFAGSLWIGGIDAGGQLKVAAMTYRQTGNDFWPGPLSSNATKNAEIEQTECNKWDKHYSVTLKEVQDFYSWFQDNSTIPGFQIPSSITDWPGNGNVADGQLQFLAPFTDVNGDGNYDPNVGDYPAYDLKNSGCDAKDRIYGDQTLWWVFNDKGDIHTETGAAPLGLEIHAQAFGFVTNDEINSMTFYKYKIFNRSTTRLDDTYFAMWVDPDLGEYGDDLIGCDVKRGLGFCYNATDQDGSGNTFTYGANPPAIGIDFFEGPFADKNGVDDPITATNNGLGYGNGIPDDERLGMEKFMFYKNDATLEGNPDNATHFYNYLSGRWKDGLPITYGGNGHATSGGTPTKYMFPWDTDDDNGNVMWEQTSFSDGRMVESAGTFSLEPGAVNYVTVGAVWARASSGGRKESVNLMKIADDKAQKLFENCFQLLRTPDAPDLGIRELDRELIITIDNDKTSNNYNEAFSVIDPLIPSTYAPNNRYVFEGYQIYQVKDATVTAVELNDPNRARLIMQSDIKNGVGRIINYEFDPGLGASVPKEMVNGSNTGVIHSFKVTEDQFATGDKNLVNHKSYHFLAIAYAYNNFKPYAQDIPSDPTCLTCPATNGQKLPYLGSSKNINVATGIPHIPAPQAGGTIAHSQYGDGVEITRIEGQGNGGNALTFKEKVYTEVLASNRSAEPVYERGAGPIQVKVIDPLAVPAADFEFRMIDTNSTIGYTQLSKGNWKIINKATGQEKFSSRSINIFNEQLIPEWGISVSVNQVPEVFCTSNDQNIIEASMKFKNQDKPFLQGLPDAEGTDPMNWIRAGSNNTDPKDYDEFTTCDATKKDYIDPSQKFEGMLTGWAPYRLTSTDADGPAWNNSVAMSQNKMANLGSVDIIFTPDQSKWSRCVVFETGNDPILSEGGAQKLNLRNHVSVDKDGNPDNSGTKGMSWFPGYAVNVETGERLNIAFGESSWLIGQNGNDMMYNPTSDLIDPLGTQQLWGGKHFIYVFGHNADIVYDTLFPTPIVPASPNVAPTTNLNGQRKSIPAYDECKAIYTLMNEYQTMATPNLVIKRAVFADVMWTGILGTNGDQFEFKNPKDMPTEATVRIRIAKPYKPYSNGAEIGRNGSLTVGKGYIVKTGPIKHNGKTYTAGQAFVARSTSFTKAFNYQTYWSVVEGGENGGLPMYKFNSNDIAADTANADAAKNALALINVVPNPYYAYSLYETTNTDSRIKFTNLPQKCTISIYASNGLLIRRLTKDDVSTSLDWDLKNTVGIPIASGVYICHVKVDGVGERTLKWFGMMRPADLEVY
jgi:hypothetical protein